MKKRIFYEKNQGFFLPIPAFWEHLATQSLPIANLKAIFTFELLSSTWLIFNGNSSCRFGAKFASGKHFLKEATIELFSAGILGNLLPPTGALWLINTVFLVFYLYPVATAITFSDLEQSCL